MRLGLVIGAALSLAGCAAGNDAGGDGDYMDDDLPMGNCSGGSGGACPMDSGNVPAGSPCGGTSECAGDLTCVAPFADDQVGDFTCSAQCISLDDEAWWCLDASACCDASAVCTLRGLCVLPGGLDDTAGDGTVTGDTSPASSTSDGSGTGSGTASSGSDSGDSGSSSGSGSSSTGGA